MEEKESVCQRGQGPVPLKVRMGPGRIFRSEQKSRNFPGFNGQGGPNRRAAMVEHVADGKTRSPTGVLRSARDL